MSAGLAKISHQSQKVSIPNFLPSAFPSVHIVSVCNVKIFLTYLALSLFYYI